MHKMFETVPHQVYSDVIKGVFVYVRQSDIEFALCEGDIWRYGELLFAIQVFTYLGGFFFLYSEKYDSFSITFPIPLTKLSRY